jgi:outer membrane receptor for ferrienterochelin and colicins
MIMKLLYKFTVLLIISSSLLIAKPKGGLRGTVVDVETNLPVVSSTVRIEGTSIGSFTNREGKFELKSIPIGKYNLLISAVGYETQKLDVLIRENRDTTLEIGLRPKILVAGEVVITANKKVQTVQEVPISLSIIKGNIFNDKSIVTIDKALKYIPAIEVNNDNISIRGSSGFAFGIGSRAILLIDGIPVLSADNGDIKSDAIPFPLIEQIEVIKGAGSALYGASALGGVINLITREPKEKMYLSATSNLGVYTKPKYKSWHISDDLQQLRQVNFAYSQRFGKFGVSSSASYSKDEGHRLYNQEEHSMFYLKTNYNFNDFTILNLSGQFSRSYRDDWVYWNSLDSATRPPTSTNLDNQISSNKYFFAAEFRSIISSNHFFTFKNGFYQTELRNELTGSEYRQSTAQSINSEIQFNSKINELINLTYGLNFINNNVKAKIYGNQNQKYISAYSQAENRFGDLVITYGGRFDAEQTDSIHKDFSKAKVEFSPKAGLAYRTAFNSTVRASIGKGFRPASIAERFASVAFQGFEVVPNTKLKNEKSISMEVGYNLPLIINSVPIILDCSIYNNELYNLIEPKFITNSSPKIQFVNTTRARVTGIDFDAKSMITNYFGTELAFNVMNPIDLDNNKKLKYRSVFSSIIRFIFLFDNFELNADYRYKSKTERVDDELRFQIKNFDARVPVHLVDASLKYKFSDFSIALSSYNLLDYYYTEVPGNLGKTRQIVLSVNYVANR